jgi:hypothetical protein
MSEDVIPPPPPRDDEATEEAGKEVEAEQKEQPKQKETVFTEEKTTEPLIEIETPFEEPPFEAFLKAYMDARGISGPKKYAALALTRLLKNVGIDVEKDMNEVIRNFNKKLSMAKQIKSLGSERLNDLADTIAASAADELLDAMSPPQNDLNVDESTYRQTIEMFRKHVFPLALAIRSLDYFFPEKKEGNSKYDEILSRQTQILEKMQEKISALESEIKELRTFKATQPEVPMTELFKGVGEMVSTMGAGFKTLVETVKEVKPREEKSEAIKELKEELEKLKESLTNSKIEELEKRLEELGKSSNVNPEILKLQHELKKEDRKFQLLMAKLIHELGMEKAEKTERAARRKAIESGFKEILDSIISAVEEEEAGVPFEVKEFQEKNPVPIECPECHETLYIIPGVTTKALCPNCGREIEVKRKR